MRGFLLLLLLIANAGYFAWTSGWLRDWGLAPATQTEPQRLAQQIRPEALRILGTGTGTGTRTGAIIDPAENTPAPAASTPAVTPQLPSPPIMTSRATTTTSNTAIRTTPSAPAAATTGAATVAAAVLAATSAAAAASAASAAARPTDGLRSPTPGAAAERP